MSAAAGLQDAWDAWRAACCEETGHAWRFLPDEGGTLPLACDCCPYTVILYPDGDVITLPWGLTLLMVTGVCGHCGEEFRRPVTGEVPPGYCRKAHADRAKEKRVRLGKSKRQERREARDAAYRIAAPRLAAAEAAAEAAAAEAAEAAEAARLALCPHPGKLTFDTPEDAVARAARESRKYARPRRAYQCAAGHWHLTTRYAQAAFIPGGPPRDLA
jgi:hypothetical protein